MAACVLQLVVAERNGFCIYMILVRASRHFTGCAERSLLINIDSSWYIMDSWEYNSALLD